MIGSRGNNDPKMAILSEIVRIGRIEGTIKETPYGRFFELLLKVLKHFGI
jgi:hypothetical protein